MTVLARFWDIEANPEDAETWHDIQISPHETKAGMFQLNAALVTSTPSADRPYAKDQPVSIKSTSSEISAEQADTIEAEIIEAQRTSNRVRFERRHRVLAAE